MTLKAYSVEIPIAGSMGISVAAESPEQAIELAWEHFNEHGADDFEVEWEALESVSSGNVSHCPCSTQGASHLRATDPAECLVKKAQG